MEIDIQEGKRLKKKRLLQVNLIFLLLFVLFALIGEKITTPLVSGLLCALLWIYTAIYFYTVVTGKYIGTKTGRLTEAFDREYQGEKKWKRRKKWEGAIILVITGGLTVFLIVVGTETGNDFRFPQDMVPFFVGWFGSNIGEMIRIGALQEDEE